jgi:hypothetical protein
MAPRIAYSAQGRWFQNRVQGREAGPANAHVADAGMPRCRPARSRRSRLHAELTEGCVARPRPDVRPAGDGPWPGAPDTSRQELQPGDRRDGVTQSRAPVALCSPHCRSGRIRPWPQGRRARRRGQPCTRCWGLVLGLVLKDGSNVRERKSSKIEPTPSTRAGDRRIFTRRADARFAALAEPSFHRCCEIFRSIVPVAAYSPFRTKIFIHRKGGKIEQ